MARLLSSEHGLACSAVGMAWLAQQWAWLGLLSSGHGLACSAEVHTPPRHAAGVLRAKCTNTVVHVSMCRVRVGHRQLRQRQAHWHIRDPRDWK